MTLCLVFVFSLTIVRRPLEMTPPRFPSVGIDNGQWKLVAWELVKSGDQGTRKGDRSRGTGREGEYNPVEKFVIQGALGIFLLASNTPPGLADELTVTASPLPFIVFPALPMRFLPLSRAVPPNVSDYNSVIVTIVRLKSWLPWPRNLFEAWEGSVSPDTDYIQSTVSIAFSSMRRDKGEGPLQTLNATCTVFRAAASCICNRAGLMGVVDYTITE